MVTLLDATPGGRTRREKAPCPDGCAPWLARVHLSGISKPTWMPIWRRPGNPGVPTRRRSSGTSQTEGPYAQFHEDAMSAPEGVLFMSEVRNCPCPNTVRVAMEQQSTPLRRVAIVVGPARTK